MNNSDFLDKYFFALTESSPKLFGFSEFLTSLALMTLVWTIADARYRFRIRTAPLPLFEITFWSITCVGFLTLFTDLWRAEHWLVPHGFLFSPASWQAFLGGVFLLTFLLWAWFALIKPQPYGRLNAERYAKALYGTILKGSSSEMAVIADELTNSMRSIVKNSTNFQRYPIKVEPNTVRTPNVEAFANDILLLIANRKFCRIIVESSPLTAFALFKSMCDFKKFGIQVSAFSRNITNEAIVNRDSFLYHEDSEYESGLIGYVKPLSTAMFSNYELVESVNQIVDPCFSQKNQWDSGQWKAYSRLILIAFKDYAENHLGKQSSAINRAFKYLSNATNGFGRYDGQAEFASHNEDMQKLGVLVEFIVDAVQILHNTPGIEIFERSHNKNQLFQCHTICDKFAQLAYEAILLASTIKGRQFIVWQVQHNTVWKEIFGSFKLENEVGLTIKYLTRRLLYTNICNLCEIPNFEGARILRICLNIMGLNMGAKGNHNRHYWALHKVVLSWVKSNFARLYELNPEVAGACLNGGFIYEPANLRIVYSRPAEGLMVARREYFLVDAA